MSVMQLIFIRCNGSGGLLYSVASQTNSIGTISRKVTFAASKFPSKEKTSNHHNKLQTIRKLPCDNSQDNLKVKTQSQLLNLRDVTHYDGNIALSRLNQEATKDNLMIKSEWLPVGHGLFYNTSKCPSECSPVTNSSLNITYFTSTKPNNNAEESEGNQNKKGPTEDTLENTASMLLRELTGIFVKNHAYDIYRPDIVLENNINGQVVNGWVNYVQKIGLLRIYAHLRYVFVQLQVKSVGIEKEEGVIIVKFCCKGYGMLKLAIDYIPKKLYKKENMSREAKVWFEAISYYHVDEEGKIFRHVLDNKEQDKEKPIQSTVESIKDKVLKLREKGVAPSPAL